MRNSGKSWDPIWEKIFSKRQWGQYPEINVVRFVAKNFYPIANRRKVNILDLGCGGGAHSWYLAREGFTVYAVDGSTTAIKQTKIKLAEDQLKAVLKQADFSHLPYRDKQFDAVIDSAAITCNRIEDAKKIIIEVLRVMKPGGKLFSELIVEDKYLKTGIGRIHFYNEKEVRELLADFSSIAIDEFMYTTDNRQRRHQSFLVEAVK